MNEEVTWKVTSPPGDSGKVNEGLSFFQMNVCCLCSC